MIHSIINEEQIFEVDIRIPKLRDIEQLVILNHRWQRENVVNTHNGFLSAEFNFETFKKIVDAAEIVIGLYNNRLISYYLTNNIFSEDIACRHRSIVDDLKSKKIIPFDSRVGLGTQALIDHPLQGSNLRSAMLRKLIDVISDKYDFLFSTIMKENLRALNGHVKDGWQLVENDSRRYYAILNLNEYTKKQLL